MIRLTLHLSQVQTETLDWIMRDNRSYLPTDIGRAHAVGDILLRHANLLGERDDRKAETDAAQQALRNELEAVRRERDAVRKALNAERATRRHDRQRHAGLRERLRDARSALKRLGESRATYRDLALRVEAALL